MKKILMSVLFCSAFFYLNAKTVRVGYFKDGGKAMNYISDDSRRSGFSYEYLQNIASYTDWEFEYVYGYWDELYKKIINGQIDILTDVSYSDSRKDLFYYSENPMAEENYYLYVNKFNPDVNAENLSSLNGKSIALGEGTYQYELLMEWLKNHNVKLNISLVPFDVVSEVGFNRGDYDLFLAIDAISDFEWEPVVKIGSSDIYAVVSKNRPDLLEELNEAQAKLYLSDPYYTSRLWGNYYSKTSVTKRLSDKEKEWLSSKKTITVGCFKNDRPYSIYNSKNGKTGGVIDFIMGEMKKNFNLQDMAVNYVYYTDKKEALSDIKQDKVDFVFPILYDNYGAEINGISLTKPVMSASFSFVFYEGMSYEKILKTVGVVKDQRPEMYFKKQDISSNSEIKYFSDNQACCNAILTGKVNSGIFNTDKISGFLFARKKYSNLTSMQIGKSEGLSFAVDNQKPEIISILNKTISMIDEPELQNKIIESSLSEKKYDYYDFIDDYSSLIITIIILIVILVIALIISLKYIKILINYDVLTHLLTRHSSKYFIQSFIKKASEKNEDFCLIIFDIDDFKLINDRFGHEIGDEVLKLTSEIILKGVSANDKVFRWGGAEFLVLLKAEKNLAESIANKIRESISKEEFKAKGKKFRVSITGGMSFFSNDKEYNQMLLEAEENLYDGKSKGKNVIVS